MPRERTLEIIKSDITFAKKIKETVNSWRGTNFTQNSGYSIDDEMKELEDRAQLVLDRLYREYGEATFPK